MVIEEKKLFFKKVTVILDDEKALALSQLTDADQFVIISHHKLPLRGFSTVEKNTGLINLSASEDEILASFNKTTRNEIKRSINDKRFEIIINSPLSDDGYELYLRFEKSLGRIPFPKKHFLPCI